MAGAALGPEAALADACGGIGTWISDKLKLDEKETRTMGFGGLSAMLGAFITNPFGGALLGLESAQGGMTGLTIYFWGLFPSLLPQPWLQRFLSHYPARSSIPIYVSHYIPNLADLLWAVPFSLIGGLAGLIFIFVFRWLQEADGAAQGAPGAARAIGGLGMGIIGALLPLTLFSGEAANSRADQAGGCHRLWDADPPGDLQAARDLPAAVHRLERRLHLPDHVCRGGPGHGGQASVPVSPTAVTVAATLAGALVAALRAPLFAALFTLVLVQAETAPVVAVAVIVSSFLMAFIALRQARSKAQVQADPQSAAP